MFGGYSDGLVFLLIHSLCTTAELYRLMSGIHSDTELKYDFMCIKK